MTQSNRGGLGTTSRLPKIAGDVVTWGAVWSALSILLQGFS
ncbi:hypothetical protein [Arsenicicoccus bolidensis]|nr:hypothetical protein [Arsenicicoccus bolidensis]